MKPKTAQIDALVLALASGLSWRAAARQAGCSHSTVARRMADPGFRLRVSARRAEMLDSASGRLSALMTDASKTLKALLSSPSDAIRLGAAKEILSAAVALRASVDHEARLTALESRQ